MAVIDPVRVVIENFEGEETLTAPNHPNRPELGERQLPFTKELYIDRADFREEANKQYKRLVLGKEVRLRNAYVIKAERVEKDANGEITTIFCTYDPETLGKNPADGRKVKGVIHWVSAVHNRPSGVPFIRASFHRTKPRCSRRNRKCVKSNLFSGETRFCRTKPC